MSDDKDKPRNALEMDDEEFEELWSTCFSPGRRRVKTAPLMDGAAIAKHVRRDDTGEFDAMKLDLNNNPADKAEFDRRWAIALSPSKQRAILREQAKAAAARAEADKAAADANAAK